MKSATAAQRFEDQRLLFWNRVLFGIVLTWAFLAMCFPLFDTDFWWHLKTGEWILSGHGIPAIDLYTFTDADKAWIDLHWGFQIFITPLYHLGGAPLVTLVKAGILTGAIAMTWQASGGNLPVWIKALIWLLPIVCISGRAYERPEMLSQLFLAFWLFLARRTDTRPAWIWALPMLQLIWVNCHALFVLGLVVGFCYAIDAVTRHWASGRFGLERRTTGLPLRTVWIVGALVGVACFINPYFEEGAFFPLTLYRKFSVEKEFYSKNILEFRPPIEFAFKYGLTNIYLIAELGVWIITAFSFLWLLAFKRQWSPFRVLLFAGFSHLAWQASRNTNIFALVAAFIATENFSEATAIQFARSSMQRVTQLQSVTKLIRLTKIVTAICVVLCGCVVTGYWNDIGDRNKPFGLGETPNWFIHDAARFAAQPGFPKRAFIANICQAEVYIYHNAPERKVFMDARLEVCTQRTFENYISVLRAMATGSTSWESLFRDGELPVVILDSRTSTAAINGMLNTRTWRLVFADRSAAVFLPIGLADKLQLSMASPKPLMFPDGPPPDAIH